MQSVERRKVTPLDQVVQQARAKGFGTKAKVLAAHTHQKREL
jgi:hypothetical protein